MPFYFSFIDFALYDVEFAHWESSTLISDSKRIEFKYPG